MEVGESGLDKDYILEYSMGRGEWWSILVPNVKGGTTSARFRGVNENRPVPLYWGEQTFSGGAFYFGAILVALFMVSLILRRDMLRWPMLVVALLAIVLSWRDASGLTDFFLESVPGFAKFRDTKMMLMLIQCMLPIGVGLLLRDVLEGKVEWGRRLLVAAGVPVVILVVFLLAPTLFFDFESHIRQDRVWEGLGESAVLPERLAVFKADVIRSLGLVILAMAVLLALVRIRMNPGANPFLFRGLVALLAIATLMDLQSVDKRYQVGDPWVRTVEYKVPYTPNQIDEAILRDRLRLDPGLQAAIDAETDRVREAWPGRIGKREQRVLDAARFAGLQSRDHFRVLNIASPGSAFSDAKVSFFHRSVGGYHGAKLRRYQDLIERVLRPEQVAFKELKNRGGMDAALKAMPVHNMLNAQYLIYDSDQPLVRNPGALGNGWFSTGWTVADGADAEMAALQDLTDSRGAVVPEEHAEALAGVVPGAADGGRVGLVEFTPDWQSYRVQAPAKGLVVFSEIHYPEGWSVTIDGESAELLRVNYAFRAVVVPEGAHDVEMRFEVPSVATARTVASAGSVLILLVLLGSLWAAWTGRGRVEEESA